MIATPKRSGRIASIELVRFLAAAYIVWTHMEEIVNGGGGVFGWCYIFIEFFFSVTGYYMMAGIMKETAPAESLESVRYSFRKAKAIYPTYLTALLAMFLINIFILSPVTGVRQVFSRLFHFKWEFVYLQMLGLNQAPQFNADYLLGAGWYLSAMFIALAPVHFLARKLRGTFSDVIAPILFCAIYFYCCQNYGTLNVGNEVTPLAMLGVLRAVAGLSMGAFIFALRDRFVSLKLKPSAKRWAAAAEIGSFALVPLMPLLSANISRQTDALIYLPLFSVLLIVGNSEHSRLNRFLGGRLHGVCVWLGKLSLYTYLFHWCCIFAAKDFLATIPGAWRYAACFALSMLVSVPVMLVTEALVARRKARKAHGIQTSA